MSRAPVSPGPLRTRTDRTRRERVIGRFFGCNRSLGDGIQEEVKKGSSGALGDVRFSRILLVFVVVKLRQTAYKLTVTRTLKAECACAAHKLKCSHACSGSPAGAGGARTGLLVCVLRYAVHTSANPTACPRMQEAKVSLCARGWMWLRAFRVKDGSNMSIRA